MLIPSLTPSHNKTPLQSTQSIPHLLYIIPFLFYHCRRRCVAERMEGEEEACNTRLCLGIGCGGYGGSEERGHGEGKPPVQLLMLFPTHLDTSREEEDGNHNDHGKNGTWKKLKLTKEQSSMLEDFFKERNNLTMMEKQALAKKLILSPRQVEVWFQNRRARTKSKQMEFHRTFLKKQCERLSNENLQLKKEMQELKLIELSSPFYSELPKATATVLAMCPSCKKIGMKEQEMEKKKELFAAMEGS